MIEKTTLSMFNNSRQMEARPTPRFEQETWPDNAMGTAGRNTAPLILTGNAELSYGFSSPLPEDDLPNVDQADHNIAYNPAEAWSTDPMLRLPNALAEWKTLPTDERILLVGMSTLTHSAIDASSEGFEGKWPTSAVQFPFSLGANMFPPFLDTGHIGLITQGAPADNRDRDRLANKLWTSFEDEPVEDGMGHIAEEILDEALRSAKEQQVFDWLKAFCTDASQPSFAASVLQCLGRLDNVGTASWRVELVRAGLAIDDIEIRGAAVQATESWGGPDLIKVLKSHTEPEPWLQQYILDVIEDLGG